MSKTILIIEDNRDLCGLLDLHLRDMNFQVDLAYDGNTGLSKARARTYDLIILDLMLPGMDGLEVCKRLRKDKLYPPILMLTAKSSEVDRVVGLEIGADDYVTKPFSIPELLARVKAILRRVEELKQTGSHDLLTELRVGDLILDTEKRTVLLKGEPIDLTAKEFDLLLHFAQNPGRVYSRAQLLDSVWGYGYEGYEHTVNSHINRLRSKIEKNPSNPAFIITVRGVGYKLADIEAADV